MADSVTPIAARKEAAGKSADVQQAKSEPKSLTLAQRMAAVRADAHSIGKQDIEMSYEDPKTNVRKTYTIKGHTVEAVLSEMRPLLVKHGVGLTPMLRERAYNGNRCDVLIDFEFQNLEDESQVKVIPWAGAGTDKGDKGFSKAGTNALKEMLKKVFLVTDRDDAKEEEEKVEHETEGGASRGDLQRAQEQRKAAIRQWASTFKAAIENAKTEKEIDRLYRDNSDQLDADDLEPVTKQFFDELKITAKGRLLAKAEKP